MPHFECGAFDHSATYPHAQVIQAVLQYTGAGAEIKAHGKAHGKKSDAAAMWKAMVCKAGQEFAKRAKSLQSGPRICKTDQGFAKRAKGWLHVLWPVAPTTLDRRGMPKRVLAAECLALRELAGLGRKLVCTVIDLAGLNG